MHGLRPVLRSVVDVGEATDGISPDVVQKYVPLYFVEVRPLLCLSSLFFSAFSLCASVCMPFLLGNPAFRLRCGDGWCTAVNCLIAEKLCFLNDPTTYMLRVTHRPILPTRPSYLCYSLQFSLLLTLTPTA